MDFRQCPACQASVLDDDATECPFCGASMSGKPSAAPARPPAGKPSAKPDAKAEAPRKRQAPARKVGETVADEEDPFGIDTSAVAKAPKVAPRPAKGRMIRIQCPMCETPGFISRKMQGRDVKCCNPDCMVPVFKAPRPQKKETDEDAKKSVVTGKMMGIAACVALLIGGLLFWGFYWSRQSSTVVDDGPGPKPFPQVEPGGNDAEPDEPEDQPAGPQTISLAEIKRQALKNIVATARVRDASQRKAFGRQLAAEAHVLDGDLAQAREQLNQLRKPSVSANIPYYQVEPLLLIAWHQLAQGDAEAAQQSIEQAAEAYQRLPQVGRQVLSSGITLASAQAAFDQIPQAKRTLRQLDAEHYRALVAALLHIVTRIETFDVDQLQKLTSLDMAVDPLAVAVAIDMASYGRWEQGVAWAKAQGDDAAREDCLSALAILAGLNAARTQQTDAMTLLTSMSGLTPSGKTRIHAGLATGLLMGGDRSGAGAELETSLESFQAINRPEPVSAPDMKQIHDSNGRRNAGLPSAAPLHSAAVAAVGLARLQASLDQQEAAWETLLQAWDFTAGIAPDLTSISRLVDEFEKSRLRAEAKLYRELNLRNNRDLRRRASNQYRRQLRIFDTAARDRFNLERGLLRDAVTMGFAEEVEKFRTDPGSVVQTAAGQPYKQANEDDRLMQAFARTEQMFADGQYTQTARMLSDFNDRQNRSNNQRRDLRAIQLACRLIDLKQVDALLKYAETLDDDWLTEDILELTGAQSVLVGLAPEMWERYERFDLQPTARVALYRGLVGGVRTHEQQQAGPRRTAARE